MFIAIIILFVFGYVAIAMEHKIKVDKAASALFIGVLCWTFLIIGRAVIFPELQGEESFHFIEHSLMSHISEIAGILFFLLGAMTIVELIDSHEGFSVITDKIKTVNRVKLVWILSVLTFFLSAALDNLTTAIVMSALIRKLVNDKKDLWLFAGMIILAANAGGAWSPIGDVTTIMLWIGGQVTAANIMSQLLLPSLVCLIVPLILMSFRMKGNVERPTRTDAESEHSYKVSKTDQAIVFYLGIAALLFVPVFKTLTHLPPFMGILLGLSILWIVTEILHRKKTSEHKTSLSIVGVLRKVDTPSILFFLGILTAVGCLQTAGHLTLVAEFLDQKLGNVYVVNGAIGVLSSIVDNVPLVAGAIGMYPITVHPVDDTFWELLAYCAGTGGSILIIGSAAGVAVMGILKIDFMWYVKNISLYALVGYLAGIGTFYLLN